MQWSRLTTWGMAVTFALSAGPASAELKPGDKLDSSNCEEARSMLPEFVTEKFCAGDYVANIVEVTDEQFQYSTKFKNGSEANAGKYYVTETGHMYETATKSWPRFWYGSPFPGLSSRLTSDNWQAELAKDPTIPYKIMYNHQVARFQIDDVYWFLALKWATPSGFDRSIEVGAYAKWYIGRHSGPTDNPDETYLKDLTFGVAPYDVVGVSTMNYWFTDPEKWQSTWVYVPTIRRVRRVTAANSSEGLFGGTIARDDVYGWGGKIQYMNWKLIGVQDILVTIPPAGIEKAMVAGTPAPKKLPANAGDITAKGQVPEDQVARITWSPEERVQHGWETPGWTGKPWAPTNLNLAKRTCWVVEATPKDPYYAYGRRIVYIDKYAYWAYWTTLYDRAGEYWKTIVWMDKMAYTPGRDMTVRHPYWGLGEDVRQNRGMIFDVQSKGYYTEYELGFPDSTFTSSNLAALGK